MNVLLVYSIKKVYWIISFFFKSKLKAYNCQIGQIAIFANVNPTRVQLRIQNKRVGVKFETTLLTYWVDEHQWSSWCWGHKLDVTQRRAQFELIVLALFEIKKRVSHAHVIGIGVKNLHSIIEPLIIHVQMFSTLNSYISYRKLLIM